MKVYSFATWKQRFPHQHSWSIENDFKKLPKVPRRVFRNKKRAHGKLGGAALLDEKGSELVYTRDARGYWFQGRKLPSLLEQFKARHPTDWEISVKDMKTEQNLREEERFKIFPNYTDTIFMQVDAFKKAGKVLRDETRDRLESVRHDLAKHLKIKPRRDRGRAHLQIENYGGSLCSFIVEIDKVTVGALKAAIMKKAGVPYFKQSLMYGPRVMDNDTAVLAQYMAA